MTVLPECIVHPVRVDTRLEHVEACLLPQHKGASTPDSLLRVKIRYPEPVLVGELVRLHVDSLECNEQPLAAVVLCHPLRNGEFEVHLCFFDPDQAQQARMLEQACHIRAYQSAQECRGQPLPLEDAAREWIDRFAEVFPALRKS
ncbi:hypothetical protein ACKC9G_02205 [Pokkaliibacter sp. CJK22405]|uniref:hypothetical protein n=1 Tax=Pokkaliibacter sp. CJK22405 TaxID=3384615 RepID=UPI003984A5D4